MILLACRCYCNAPLGTPGFVEYHYDLDTNLRCHVHMCCCRIPCRRCSACGSKPMVPFWGRCTTHFRTYFSGCIGMFLGGTIWILTHGLLHTVAKGLVDRHLWNVDPRLHALATRSLLRLGRVAINPRAPRAMTMTRSSENLNDFMTYLCGFQPSL